MRRRLATAAGLLIATVLCAWAALGPSPVVDPGALIAERGAPRRSEPALYREGLLPLGSPAIAHVPSLAELPDGQLVAVWYQGSQECAADVEIFVATQTGAQRDEWGTPRRLLTREAASAELHRRVGKVGNAVVFADAQGRLWLVYVTMPFGGWALASLNVKLSADQGESWSPSRRLTTIPLFNFSTLVKNKPILLAGGAVVLPVSHEFVTRFPLALWLEVGPLGGPEWRVSRIGGGSSYFQPAFVAVDGRRAVALLRSTRVGGRVGRSLTVDGGCSWSEPSPTDLPNPDSGLDAVLLSDGSILLAFNDDPTSRSNLRLAVSDDLGVTWRRIATLEKDPAGSFAYPFLLRARDGATHLVYTWRGNGIKHVTFNDAWLASRLQEPR